MERLNKFAHSLDIKKSQIAKTIVEASWSTLDNEPSLCITQKLPIIALAPLVPTIEPSNIQHQVSEIVRTNTVSYNYPMSFTTF